MQTTSLVSFYLLQSPNVQQDLFVCRLVYKIWRQGFYIHILTPDKEMENILDDRLWDWKKEHFIPHHSVSAPTLPTALPEHYPETKGHPVTIGDLPSEIIEQQSVLINLTESPLENFKAYYRTCEIVPDPNDKQREKTSARNKYIFYRDQGAKLKTVNIN